MSANNITELVQESVCDFIRTLNLGDIDPANIYAGISRGHDRQADPDPQTPDDTVETQEDGLRLPAVVVNCTAAAPEIPFEGNWKCAVEVMVMSNADDTLQADHLARAGNIFAGFAVLNAAYLISVAAQTAQHAFTAFLVTPGQQSYQLQERAWVSVQLLEIDCCGSVVG